MMPRYLGQLPYAHSPGAKLGARGHGAELGAADRGSELGAVDRGAELATLTHQPVRAFIPYLLPHLGFSISPPPVQPYESTYLTSKTLI
jgi:hypothetical protein